MVRRTGWHYYEKDSAGAAEQVATWMQQCLGWDEETRTAELQRYHETTSL